MTFARRIRTCALVVLVGFGTFCRATVSAQTPEETITEQLDAFAEGVGLVSTSDDDLKLPPNASEADMILFGKALQDALLDLPADTYRTRVNINGFDTMVWATIARPPFGSLDGDDAVVNESDVRYAGSTRPDPNTGFVVLAVASSGRDAFLPGQEGGNGGRAVVRYWLRDRHPFTIALAGAAGKGEVGLPPGKGGNGGAAHVVTPGNSMSALAIGRLGAKGGNAIPAPISPPGAPGGDGGDATILSSMADLADGPCFSLAGMGGEGGRGADGAGALVGVGLVSSPGGSGGTGGRAWTTVGQARGPNRRVVATGGPGGPGGRGGDALDFQDGAVGGLGGPGGEASAAIGLTDRQLPIRSEANGGRGGQGGRGGDSLGGGTGGTGGRGGSGGAATAMGRSLRGLFAVPGFGGEGGEGGLPGGQTGEAGRIGRFRNVPIGPQ